MLVMPTDPHSIPLVVLYVGPDQIMPLTSVLGALFGFALMFWHRLAYLAKRCWTFLNGKRPAELPEAASNASDLER
jgi:hypothetical protein